MPVWPPNGSKRPPRRLTRPGPSPCPAQIIQKYWKEGSSKGLDPVGPSPLLIHREQLQRVAKRWLDWSLDLRSNGVPHSHPNDDDLWG